MPDSYGISVRTPDEKNLVDSPDDVAFALVVPDGATRSKMRSAYRRSDKDTRNLFGSFCLGETATNAVLNSKDRSRGLYRAVSKAWSLAAKGFFSGQSEITINNLRKAENLFGVRAGTFTDTALSEAMGMPIRLGARTILISILNGDDCTISDRESLIADGWIPSKRIRKKANHKLVYEAPDYEVSGYLGQAAILMRAGWKTSGWARIYNDGRAQRMVDLARSRGAYSGNNLTKTQAYERHLEEIKAFVDIALEPETKAAMCETCSDREWMDKVFAYFGFFPKQQP